MDILAAFIAATAVFVLAWKSLSAHVPVVERPEPETKDIILFLAPVLRVLALPVRGLITERHRQWMQSKLDAAGMRPYLTPDELFAARFVLIGLAWVVGFAFTDGFKMLLLGVAAVFPEMWVFSLIKIRHVEIRRTMPYFTDLLAMCTRAGLDFGSAIDRVVAQTENSPLVGELKLVRRDHALGKSQQDALMAMAKRVQLPELNSFVAIVVQAIRMGASVADILDAQAAKMRIERYESAERLGAQAQQKILMPLLLLILPAFVLLGIVPMMMALAAPLFEGGLFDGLAR